MIIPLTLPGCDVKIVLAPMFRTAVQKVNVRDLAMNWGTDYMLYVDEQPVDDAFYRYVIRYNVLRENDATAMEELTALLEVLWDGLGKFKTHTLVDPYDDQTMNVRFEEDSLTTSRIVNGLWKSAEIRLYGKPSGTGWGGPGYGSPPRGPSEGGGT